MINQLFHLILNELIVVVSLVRELSMSRQHLFLVNVILQITSSSIRESCSFVSEASRRRCWVLVPGSFKRLRSIKEEILLSFSKNSWFLQFIVELYGIHVGLIHLIFHLFTLINLLEISFSNSFFFNFCKLLCKLVDMFGSSFFQLSLRHNLWVLNF